MMKMMVAKAPRKARDRMETSPGHWQLKPYAKTPRTLSGPRTSTLRLHHDRQVPGTLDLLGRRFRLGIKGPEPKVSALALDECIVLSFLTGFDWPNVYPQHVHR
jgi:hypothetical protein